MKKSTDKRSFTDRQLDRLLAKFSRRSENQLLCLFTLPMPLFVVVIWVLSPGAFWKIVNPLIFAIGYFIIISALVALKEKGQRTFLLRRTRDLGEIRGLKWREFENFIAGLLEIEGYETELVNQGGPDGGIDIIARKNGKTKYVQCKHYRWDEILPEPVRALYGVMMRDGATDALFVTSGIFSNTTREEFKDCDRLELRDGADVVNWIEKLQNQLPDKDEEGEAGALEFTRRIIKNIVPKERTGTVNPPQCRKCNASMILKYSRKNNQRFWACRNYPDCEHRTALSTQEIDILDPDRNR